MEEEIVCPKCHSGQISANQRGFNASNAIIGNMAGGAAIGLGMGMAGSNKIIITCLKCGNQFKAGDGTIKRTDEAGKLTYEKQIFVDKDKGRGKTIAVVLLVVLIIFILIVVGYFNSLP